MFVALLKQFVLGDRLKKYMWVGIFWNVVSIFLIGQCAGCPMCLNVVYVFMVE